MLLGHLCTTIWNTKGLNHQCCVRYTTIGCRVSTAASMSLSLYVSDLPSRLLHPWIWDITGPIVVAQIQLVLHRNQRSTTVEYLRPTVNILECTFHGLWRQCVVHGDANGSQMAERWGSRASNLKVAGSIPGCANDVVSLGKPLHPTCLKGMSLYLL